MRGKGRLSIDGKDLGEVEWRWDPGGDRSPLDLGEITVRPSIEVRTPEVLTREGIALGFGGVCEVRINGGPWRPTPHRTAEDVGEALGDPESVTVGMALAALFGRPVIFTQHEAAYAPLPPPSSI